LITLEKECFSRYPMYLSSVCVTKISETLGVESESLSNSTNHGGFGPPSLADRSERQIAITLH
jgi:hypothetical protein